MPTEPTNVTQEQLDRKARSESRLRSEGVAINATLPVIEREDETTLRTRDAVVERAIALMIVAVKGEGLEQEVVDKIRTQFGADAFFSPKEKTFVLQTAPSKSDRVQFSWRYECIGVMHWALGYVAELRKPDAVVDAGEMVKILEERGANGYRAGAKLRSTAAILDEADLIYRYDWACVDARYNKRPAPKGIDCGIVVERHHALNWLIGYMGQAWDDVSTDT